MIKQFLPWILAALYFLSPYDAFPDTLFGPGWLDDILVFGIAFWWYRRMRRSFGQETYGPRQDRQRHDTEEEKNREETHHADNPYTILGVQPGATKEEIRKAYTQLAARYHPDKVQHLGEDFQELAHKKFVAIQRAYDALK
jgi:hypothetical protein